MRNMLYIILIFLSTAGIVWGQASSNPEFQRASELEEKNLGLVNAVDRLQTLYQMGLAINATIDNIIYELFQTRKINRTIVVKWGD